ncbi:MAG: two-component system response regulator [Geobacter sp.]|nr:MAG: two-component system response regulator [Geobacter sp.]
MSTANSAMYPILLVDDEEEILFSMSIMFRTEGVGNVLTENNSRNVMALLEKHDIALIILDLSMPVLSGYELLKEIASNYPHIPVIIMTAANELEMAVDCMKAGAFDYFVKPAEKDRLLASTRRALEMHALRNQVTLLTEQLLSDRLEPDRAFAPIVTRSPKMRGIFRYLTAVAGTGQPVLICGETGVGKELVARSIHDSSSRQGPFVAVNIAGLDDQMFADTLFGHCKGAFTGADQTREGLIAKASGGTLFLDEIGDLPQLAQIKLLRLLQEQEYYPLGTDIPKKCDARIILATNKDLATMMSEGVFRKDLYYRISAHQVRIPPLRERLEDIPLLLDYFLDEAAETLNKARPTHSAELCSYLSAYDFPGNIRELRAMILDAVACHAKGMLSLASFRKLVGHRGVSSQADPLVFLRDIRSGNAGTCCMPTLKDTEDALVAHALSLAGGNQGIAASYLGITRQALNKRLSRKNDRK